jgi:lipoprotein NlpI
MRTVLVLSAGLVLMGGTARAQKVEFKAKDLKLCEQSQNNPDLTIQACSRLINSFKGYRPGEGLLLQVLTTGFAKRASAYDDKGEYDLAIQDIDQVILLNPNFPENYNSRGIIYYEKGAYDRAIQDYDQAIRLKSDFHMALNNRGNAYREKGDYDRAIQDYDQAIRIRPDYLDAFDDRGDAHRKKGDYDRAIQDYDQAIRINPSYAFSIYKRGATRFMQSQFAAAVPDFAKCATLAPSNRYMALWLYIARVRAGQKADDVLTAMRQLDLNSWPGPVVSLCLGMIAPETMLGAASNPDSKEQQGHLCEAQFYLGEYELLHAHLKEAAEGFQAAIGTCMSNSIESQVAKEELKQLKQ